MTSLVVVAGALASRPRNGGGAWVRLSYIRGLRRLGFRVLFLEQIADSLVDRPPMSRSDRDGDNVAFFRDVVARFGLVGDAALITESGREIAGLRITELTNMANEAEALLNISGNLTFAPLMARMRRKVYLDLDPGYTQLWHHAGLLALGGHAHYFTVGANIGSGTCPIPTGEIVWRPTRPPVVLDDWPVSVRLEHSTFTTVGSWRGAYGPVVHAGHVYGSKAHEFRKIARLPELVPQSFEAALAMDPADDKDHRLLTGHGWRLVDPVEITADPSAFRHYVQASDGECSAAQGMYVGTNSGWFSDRTTRYLASGKPVLIQDTGFSQGLPTGEGLISFQTLEGAVAGAHRIAEDYDAHCRAARAIAEEHFHSDVVLAALVDAIGIAP